MTVWIQKHNNEISDDFTFAAFIGFRNMGEIVKFFTKPDGIHYKKQDIVVGSINSVRSIMKSIHVDLPNFYIPNELQKYAGRKIYKSTIGSIIERVMHGEKLFIKPVTIKEFPAQVVDSLPLMTFIGQDFKDNMECWVSEVIDFVSEYRIFLLGKEPIGCKHYWGDFKICPDWKIIDSAIADLINPPAGWCLDFGITNDGTTLLIEANDGYSIGNYGLDGMDYVRILKARWFELLKTARKLE